MKVELRARAHGFVRSRCRRSWRTLLLVVCVAVTAGATTVILRAQRAMRPPAFAAVRGEKAGPVRSVQISRVGGGIELAFDVTIERSGPHFAYARIGGIVRGERHVVTARRRFARLAPGRTRLTLAATGAAARDLEAATAPTLEYLVVADVGDHPPRPIAQYGR